MQLGTPLVILGALGLGFVPCSESVTGPSPLQQSYPFYHTSAEVDQGLQTLAKDCPNMSLDTHPGGGVLVARFGVWQGRARSSCQSLHSQVRVANWVLH